MSAVGAVDYDQRLHARYVEGAALSPATMVSWLAAFDGWLPCDRPLRLADVGSGTGRFSPALADAFGGPVFGIEPSARMRALAAAGAPHPRVSYVGGCCEAIPLGDDAVDAALLFGVWHHVGDRPAGATELARVVRPGGTLLVRTSSSDRLARPWWDQWFPEVNAIDRAVLPSLAETVSTLLSARWELLAIDDLVMPTGWTKRQDFERLRSRALSTLEYLDDDVVEVGLQRIAASLDHDPNTDEPAPAASHDLVVLSRRG